MPLQSIVARVRHTFTFRFVSKAVSSLILISVLAGSMPAAPRMVVDAAPKIPQLFSSIDSSLQSINPLQYASDISVPTIDTTPALAFFNHAAESAGDMKALLLPSAPAGLESAKLPTLTERTFAFISPVLAFLKSSTTVTAPAPPTQPASVVDFDFDNDGKADIGRWRGALTDYDYKVRNSNGGSYSTYAITTAGGKLAPGDFNGDGKTDAGVFNIVSGAGVWTYKTSPTATAQTISFGTTGDIPVAGDYDGDGTTDAAIYRPSTNTWWIKKSSNGSTISTTFGAAGDITVPGDYDGDGKNDLALFRPSTGDWHITPSSTGVYYSFHWGLGSDTPVPADYDCDGKTDMAVFRPSTGTWYVNRSDGGSFLQQSWGNYRDQPVPADYDGDGKADYAIWRPTTGVWYISRSSDSGFEMYTLGAPGETAVPSAYLKQVGGEVTGDALNAARMSPRNATGGTDLYSQNFGWSTSLVNLPGRAGLDANLGISYNSLVWTKVGSAVVFDADNSNASPGFRLGLPTVEPIYYDTDKGKSTWAYLMVTPSGERVQFRQTLVTNVYETADSNHTQLVVNGASSPNDPSENLWLLVRTTDGTQMFYSWSLGAYRCTQIKDRNGNYITVEYNGEGQLWKMTDTLGRVIVVSYDSATGLPSSINFPRYAGNGNGSLETSPWVTFTYTDLTISTTFGSSLTVVGPPNGTVIKVLDRVTYADGSNTRFSYNGFAQVSKVEMYAPNGGFLNYVAADYIQSPTSEIEPSTLEVPLLRQTRTKVKDFNNDAEVKVTNELRAGNVTDIDGATVSAKLIQVQMLDHPTGNVTNTFVGASGWMERLPIRVDDYANGTSGLEIKRSSFTRWTQDDTSPGIQYPINPRITESQVSDGANTKKTAIEYWTASSTVPHAGLVKKVEIGSLSRVYKTIETTYQLDSAYVSRRIIGLPLEVKTSGYNDLTTLNEDVSDVIYAYDGENFSYESNQVVTPTKHDTTNYGSSFVTGRGNLTSTTRHDVTSATADSVSKTRYDIAGSPVAQLDPLNRKIAISYTDNFNTTPSNPTLAYPTTLTDAGGNSSTIQYRFDLGSNVWARSPKPEGSTNTYGKTTSRTYDEVTGRLTKEKIENNGAYTRYEYPTTGLATKSYTTIADITGVGTVDSSDEVLSESVLDGAGRTLKARTENPNSTGGYSGKKVQYSLLGQVIAESVPTEINSSWNPTGDDSRGLDTNGNPVWLWNQKEYDWKGRTTREINTDGTDRTYSYAGCGCAGGQVTTIKGEITEAVDTSNTLQTTKRRTQKLYEDVMGRTIKTELWDLDGSGSTPYSTTLNSFSGGDQIIRVRKQVGSSGTYQDTTFEFDGHGRLKRSHKPEWFNSSISNPTYTTYTYNTDDTISSVTEPRGATTSYEYGGPTDPSEHRGLLKKVSYTTPDSTTIHAPGDVSFVYDPAGNRKSMTDESGSLTYTYDELSRIASETKAFADTLSSAPSGGYKLVYGYTLSGGIESIKDPNSTSGWEVTYTSDKIGRATEVGNGSSSTGFAKNIAYRAFGGVKSMQYSTTDVTNISLSYDNRLRPVTYEAESSANTTDIQNKTYSYNNDGGIKQATNMLDATYSQTYEYDFASRLKKNEMGGTSGPYKQTLSYDAFDHLTSRSTTVNGATPKSFTSTYQSNRKSSGGYGEGYDLFDSAGNVWYNKSSTTPLDQRKWKFDATGRVSDWEETTEYWAGVGRWDQGEELTFDGNGRSVRRLKRSRTSGSPPAGWAYTPEYYLYSSVTGKIVVKLNASGQATKRNIHFNGTTIAEVTPGSNQVAYKHSDPVAGSEMQTESSGEISPYEAGRTERAALNVVIPTTEPEIGAAPHDYEKGASSSSPESGAIVDGVMHSFDFALRLIRARAADIDPNNSDPFLLGRLGLSRTPVFGYRDIPEAPDPEGGELEPEGGVFKVNGGVEKIFLGWEYHLAGRQTNNEKLSDAMKDALDALRHRKACRDLFSSDIDPAQLLWDLYAGENGAGSLEFGDLGAPTGSGNSTRVAAAKTDGVLIGGGVKSAMPDGKLFEKSMFGSVIVTINSNAVAPWRAGFSDFLGVGASDRVYRAMILIHEIGHAARILAGSEKASVVQPDTGAIPNVAEVNRSNSQQVYDACFKPVPK